MSSKRLKCDNCNQYKLEKHMLDNKAGICNNCNNNKSIIKHKPEYRNGLYFKPNTNLVIRVDPYGVNKRL